MSLLFDIDFTMHRLTHIYKHYEFFVFVFIFIYFLSNRYRYNQLICVCVFCIYFLITSTRQTIDNQFLNLFTANRNLLREIDKERLNKVVDIVRIVY